ncbi:MAG: zinc-ribbon domain-containing protein [Dehalococcoidia bacterium]|nr:zinc-ribbon domain-containing protein [Dehalococcoidia bacterium]MDH5781319.1 zinc-ribbon domain-containing protein [Dehalococcoidia bacterium]
MFCPKCGAENPEGAKFCSKCGAELGVSAKPSETSVGLSANVAGLLCYVLGWISGIVFLIIEKKSKFVKFHAWQSIMTFGVLNVTYLILFSIPIIGWILGWVIWVLGLVLWIILMIQAGTGKMWKLPWAGNWAERQASKAS